MQNQENFNSQSDGTVDASISLADILRPLWHSRRTILIVTLLVTAGTLAGSLHFAKYKSEGYFQFGGAIPSGKEKEHSSGITLSDYKRYSASYATRERFADFVRDNKLDSTVGIDDLSEAFESRAGIRKLVEPIYAFSKLDSKELMDQPRDGGSNVIGLRINFASRSPEIAQQIVGQLGSYVMDSIIYQIYLDELQYKQSEIKARMTKLDNVIIANKELLAKYQRKGADLKQIVSRYPESTGQASRQVISVTEDSARYLSPVTLLVTTEVQASEVNESIRRAKRELRQSALWLEYYDRAKVLLDGTKSGKSILLGLEPVKESVFEGKNLEDDVIKEVFNAISIDNQNAIELYLKKSNFIAGPTLPTYSSTRPMLALVLSLIAGLFLSVVLVFARNWWRDNWRRVSV